MALRLLLALLDAVIPFGRWVIVTPRDTDVAEVKRWCEAIEIAESSAGLYLKLPKPYNPVLRVAPSSGDFAAWTGLSIWHAAAVIDGELVVQPLAVLERRGVLEQVLTHEYVHLSLEPYRVPRWFNEGLAVLCSGELRTIAEDQDIQNLPSNKEEIEALLCSSDTSASRRGYLAAARIVQQLIKEVGRDSLVRLIKEEAL